MTDYGVMATGSGSYDRPDDDFYETPELATQALIDFLGRSISEQSIWECACGKGAISEVLKNNGMDVVSTNLIDYGYGQGGIDFLLERKGLADFIITNPPFNLAVNFIEHAQNLDVNGFAFLLKSTYFHAASRRKLYMKQPPAYILPLTWRLDFTGQGNPVMECSWFVWTNCKDRNIMPTPEYWPLKKPEQKNGNN